MSVVAGTEVEWDIDLNATIPCEYPILPTGQCTNEAIWKGTRPCCGVTVIMCGPHHALCIARDAEVDAECADAGVDPACGQCGSSPCPEIEWRLL